MNEYRPAKKRITVSVGESVKIIREPQELSQNQLSQLTGIPQATIFNLFIPVSPLRRFFPCVPSHLLSFLHHLGAMNYELSAGG